MCIYNLHLCWLWWRRCLLARLGVSLILFFNYTLTWNWNSNTWAPWCEELTHLKRPWCWERLKAGGEGDDREWDGWMASPTQWTWVWVNSGSWWWTGRRGMLRFMVSQRVRHDWATEVNWRLNLEIDSKMINALGSVVPKNLWGVSESISKT